jgi:hypothetical protein
MEYVFGLFYLGISYLIAAKIGKYKTLGFWKTFFLCLAISPFLGYFIAANSRLIDARGCRWCGNNYNEAEYCGLCGKNEKGEIRPGFTSINKSSAPHVTHER